MSKVRRCSAASSDVSLALDIPEEEGTREEASRIFEAHFLSYQRFSIGSSIGFFASVHPIRACMCTYNLSSRVLFLPSNRPPVNFRNYARSFLYTYSLTYTTRDTHYLHTYFFFLCCLLYSPSVRVSFRRFFFLSDT